MNKAVEISKIIIENNNNNSKNLFTSKDLEKLNIPFEFMLRFGQVSNEKIINWAKKMLSNTINTGVIK